METTTYFMLEYRISVLLLVPAPLWYPRNNNEGTDIQMYSIYPSLNLQAYLGSFTKGFLVVIGVEKTFYIQLNGIISQNH